MTSGLVLAKRIVGQLGQMRNRVAAAEVLVDHFAQVLVQGMWTTRQVPIVAIEPAVA